MKARTAKKIIKRFLNIEKPRKAFRSLDQLHRASIVATRHLPPGSRVKMRIYVGAMIRLLTLFKRPEWFGR